MIACTSCGNDVTGKNFCPNCGASTRIAAGYSAPAPLTCAHCGRQSDPGSRFCNNCGSQFVPGTPTWQTGNRYPQANYPEAPYQQQPTNYAGSPGYAPYQSPYGHQVPGAPHTPAQPQMVLCCPTCQTISALGTSYCRNCHSSLIGVYPTPVQPPQPANEVHIHHHHGQPGHPGQHYGPHGYPHRRRGDSGPLDGMGGALAAGAGGLLGGLILGEVAEEIFDDD